MSFAIFANEIRRFPVLTREEELALAIKFKTNSCLESAKKLVQCNLRFVVKVAHEFKHYGFDLLDLVQEGTIGLMRAVRKFDPYKGVKLITYAVSWIRVYIREFIIKTWAVVKIGTTGKEKNNFFKPQTEESEMSTRKLPYVPIDEDTINFIKDDRLNPEEAVIALDEEKTAQDIAVKALSQLSEREQLIVYHRVMSDDIKTRVELAEELSISAERVRQIENNALYKLRRQLDGGQN